MAADRTFVTELATGLGMVGGDDLASIIARRPTVLANLGMDDWERLTLLWRSRVYNTDFEAGFVNGRAFFAAADALNGRRPRVVEWTGGRRAPGDEVVPSDLRVDHVYLVSCKYLSRVLHNPSPARLVEGLLSSHRLPSTTRGTGTSALRRSSIKTCTRHAPMRWNADRFRRSSPTSFVRSGSSLLKHYGVAGRRTLCRRMRASAASWRRQPPSCGALASTGKTPRQ